MGNLVRVLTEVETFGVRAISGAMGGEPPPVFPPPEPVSPPVSPPVTPPSPTTIPQLVATPAGAVVGSVWVEGSELHYIAATGVEYAGTGDSVSTPSGALIGSMWEAGDDLFYIDASGVKRQVQKTAMGAKDAAATIGSLWVDSASTAGQQLHWVSNSTRYRFWNGV